MGRVAVVMSGGGAKGSFELGALDYLIRDHGADPEVVVGVSTGNLNAALLAQGQGHNGLLQQLTTLEEIWLGIDENDDVYYNRIGGMFGLLVKADSVYSNKPLWKLIQRYVDPARLRSSGRLLRIGVVGLKAATYYAIKEDHPRIREMIRASAAIPVFFNPVDIDGERYVDGGVMNVTPLAAAFDALAELNQRHPAPGATPDTIYIILASPTTLPIIADDEQLDSGIEIGIRSLEIAINEIYRNDLSLAAAINESVKYYERAKAQCGNSLPTGFPFANYRYADLVLVRPDVFHMDSLDFDPTKIRHAFQDGRNKMEKAIAETRTGGGTNITPDMLKKLTG